MISDGTQTCWERNQVLNCDCMDFMREQPSGTIPLVITDPPYGIGYHSNHYKEKNPHAPIAHDWNFQIAGFLSECARILKDSGALYLFCRWDVAPLWVPHIAANGLRLKTVIAWVKDNWSAGDLEGCFGNQYEQILFITKGRHILRGKRWPNVWNFPRVPAKQLLHPAQKPVPLLERAVKASSDEGDLVLDLFAGSGSTGEACKNAGRDFLLCDIDPKMVEIARLRLGMEATRASTEEYVVTPSFEIPDPADWGVHPEELHAIYAELNGHLVELHTARQLAMAFDERKN